MKKINIGNTKSNHTVYVMKDNEHMQAHASVDEKLLSEAIQKVKLQPPFGFYTVDIMGRIIGTDNCVETTDGDDIRMEYRPGRDIPSRMVYGRAPEKTSLLTIGICTDDDGLETVFTAFPGKLAPKELSGPRLSEEERPEAETFWASHALCAD